MGTHDGNLLKTLESMSRVAYFILWVTRETAFAKTNAFKKQGEDFLYTHIHTRAHAHTHTNGGEWIWKAEIRTRRIFLAVGEA